MSSLQLPPGRRAAVIYNPIARTLARHLDVMPRVAELLKRQNIDCRLVPTVAPGSATEQAREQIADGCNLIVVAGGDGTVNEVADGMLYTGIPLAIIPGGTANVLARELRLPMDAEKAAKAMAGMRMQTITLGNLRSPNLRSRSFLCMMGVGLDADIISRLNLDFKAAAGKLAYYLCGFSQLARILPEFDVNVDGRPYRASFALISRVRNYGGDLEIARGASLLRDDFEAVLFRGSLAVRYIPYLAGVALKKVHRMNGVQVVRGNNVTCKADGSEKVFAQIDGELIGELPVEAETVAGALTLLVPPEFIAREQKARAAVSLSA